ncbi:MAG: SRPBCC family protein [Deltaproteobacteria bacterium]|nr:SRPBCC family protein [Deltaproteobacteria bacterium]
MPRIEIARVVRAPQERLFDLARSIDAHVASTPGTEERPIGGKTSGLLALGEEVTWEARHLGVTQRLTSRITLFDRPRHFRDSMVKGAFARFDHDHYFEVVAGDPDATRCRDVFDFDAPLGPLGWIAERAFLERYMRRFLEVRMRILEDLATGDQWSRFV